METTTKKILLSIGLIGSLMISGWVKAESKIVYPLSQISELDCRFQKFSELSEWCKRELPILTTKNYKKYIALNDWYNDYTRIYTVLWGSSYKYGWDQWNGWHMGVDIATAEWTPVYAIADGVVDVADNLIAWGNAISVEHKISWKTVISNYAHLSKILVEVWDTVSAGDKIGEVWSTGNSTWNHLHFQIDLKYKYHPYYYDYASCPYSYNEISESDVCFPELAKHTIDPLLFLETSWAVLDDIQVETKAVTGTQVKSSLSTGEGSLVSIDESIFTRTVYLDSPRSDVELVQQIMKSLGEYTGAITWDYADILESIVKYQLSNNIIASKSDTGAGYFGPKTRTQVENDYKNFITSGGKMNATEDVIISNLTKTEKIEKKWMLTREEIEAREIKEFFRNYNIELNFKTPGWNVAVGENIILNLTITSKNGRPFKWNTPGDLTFVVDREKVDVFPNKLYNFTDGKRDIKITWLKTWDTKLYIKIGNTEIKSFDIKIFDGKAKIYGSNGKIISNSKVVIWEQKTGVLLMQDANKKSLVNLKYHGTYKLSSKDNVQFCIKKGPMTNIKKIYSTPCTSANFKDSLEFTYEDTVWWILIFDYKILDSNAKIDFVNTFDNKVFNTKTIATVSPKGLVKSYEYYNEVLNLLSAWVLDGINKWYFMQDRWLTEADAAKWIENMLIVMKSSTTSNTIKKDIDTKITLLKEENISKFNYISRSDFLEKVYSYLIYDQEAEITINYRDLDTKANEKANLIFDKNNTWKDQFGDNYYRPEKTLTRWEWAYLLGTLLEKTEKAFVTLR